MPDIEAEYRKLDDNEKEIFKTTIGKLIDDLPSKGTIEEKMERVHKNLALTLSGDLLKSVFEGLEKFGFIIDILMSFF